MVALHCPNGGRLTGQSCWTGKATGSEESTADGLGDQVRTCSAAQHAVSVVDGLAVARDAGTHSRLSRQFAIEGRAANSILRVCCAWRECHGRQQRRCGENSSGEHELLLAAACVAAMKPGHADARFHWRVTRATSVPGSPTRREPTTAKDCCTMEDSNRSSNPSIHKLSNLARRTLPQPG